jgi:hypothetical protein
VQGPLRDLRSYSIPIEPRIPGAPVYRDDPLGIACVVDIQGERVDAGDNDSSSHIGVVCVLDITSCRVRVGVTSEEAETGVSVSGKNESASLSRISRAGFGNVLYVEPSDVYLQMTKYERK